MLTLLPRNLAFFNLRHTCLNRPFGDCDFSLPLDLGMWRSWTEWLGLGKRATLEALRRVEHVVFYVQNN